VGDNWGKEPAAVTLDQKPSVYIIIDRDRRLPAAFTAAFKAVTEAALSDVRFSVGEDAILAKEVTQADWVMTVRASRIVPRYTFQPSEASELNGFIDCLADSAALAGLLFAPCLIQGDEDILDAEVRDRQARLVKRYHLEEAASGFTMLPPFTYLTNLDERARWENLGRALYERLRADQVFDTTAGPNRERVLSTQR
jgi:hypothetical protein